MKISYVPNALPLLASSIINVLYIRNYHENLRWKMLRDSSPPESIADAVKALTTIVTQGRRNRKVMTCFNIRSGLID